MSYNIHGLSHLADDCRIYGNLNNFTAYEFESRCGWIKNTIKCKGKELQNAVKNITSQFKHSLENYNKNEKQPCAIKQIIGSQFFKRVNFESYFLHCDEKNCWYLTRDLKIFKFVYSCDNKGVIFIYGKELVKKRNVNVYPFESSKLFIFTSDGEITDNLFCHHIEEIKGKMNGLRLNENFIYFCPILHTLK